MTINILNNIDIPIYIQISNQIKNSILSGELKQNDPLPSIRNLARELKVSVITTKKAFEQLEKDGFIVTVAGKGSYVLPHNELMKETKFRYVEECLSKAIEIANLMGIPQNEVEKMLKLLYENN